MAAHRCELEQSIAAKIEEIIELRPQSGQKRELHCFFPAEVPAISGSNGLVLVEITVFNHVSCPERVRRLIMFAVEEGVHKIFPDSPVVCAVDTHLLGPGLTLK